MPSRSLPSVRIFYPKWTRHGLIRHLRARLPLLADRLPLVRVVLFGSYAKGTFTVASDVDLLIIYRGKHRENAYALVRKTLNIPHLEPHVYTLDEVESMKATVGRMERQGVVLFNRIENQGGPTTNHR